MHTVVLYIRDLVDVGIPGGAWEPPLPILRNNCREKSHRLEVVG